MFRCIVFWGIEIACESITPALSRCRSITNNHWVIPCHINQGHPPDPLRSCWKNYHMCIQVFEVYVQNFSLIYWIVSEIMIFKYWWYPRIPKLRSISKGVCGLISEPFIVQVHWIFFPDINIKCSLRKSLQFNFKWIEFPAKIFRKWLFRSTE